MNKPPRRLSSGYQTVITDQHQHVWCAGKIYLHWLIIRLMTLHTLRAGSRCHAVTVDMLWSSK